MFKLLESKTGVIIMSVIWGLGLACMFRKVCKDRDCIVYNAPNMEEIKKNIFLFDKKCYKYKSETTKCNTDPIS